MNRYTDYGILVPHIMVIKPLIIKLKGGQEKSAYFLDCNSNKMNYDTVILEVGTNAWEEGVTTYVPPKTNLNARAKEIFEQTSNTKVNPYSFRFAGDETRKYTTSTSPTPCT